jgi:hypothetical protein
VLEDKNLVNELVWKVANGEIPSVEAAKQCGLSYQVFYKRLRKNKEAFAVFREKVSKRKRPLVEHQYNIKFERDSDVSYMERVKKTMNEYHSKCNIADKVAQARALGMSYGYYSALVVNGLGKL